MGSRRVVRVIPTIYVRSSPSHPQTRRRLIATVCAWPPRTARPQAGSSRAVFIATSRLVASGDWLVALGHAARGRRYQTGSRVRESLSGVRARGRSRARRSSVAACAPSSAGKTGDASCQLSGPDAEALAQVLRPTRPDLGETATRIGANTAATAGIRLSTSAEALAAVLEAAALAAGAGADEMRGPFGQRWREPSSQASMRTASSPRSTRRSDVTPHRLDEGMQCHVSSRPSQGTTSVAPCVVP